MELTKEVLQQRKQGIGGSDSGAVLGLSKFSTPLDVYLDKVSEVANSRDVSEDLQTTFDLGHILEPYVVKKYEDRTGLKCAEEPNVLKNPKYPWMLANIDRWVLGKSSIMEAKTTRYFDEKEWGYEGTDDIPETYLIQCAHYCIVCDSIKKITHVDLAALCKSNSNFRIYVYERNKELEEAIIDKTHDFWVNHVEKRIPPEATNSADLKRLYTEVFSDNSVEADNNMCLAVDKLVSVRRQMRPLKDQEDDIKEKIKLYMLDQGVLVDSTGRQLATWKGSKPSEKLDSKQVKAKYPDVYADCLKDSKSEVARRFLLKEKV